MMKKNNYKPKIYITIIIHNYVKINYILAYNYQNLPPTKTLKRTINYILQQKANQMWIPKLFKCQKILLTIDCKH